MLDRIKKKIAFLREIDKLKSIMRRAFVLGGERYENDAEHSWHATLMAVLFIDEAKDRNVDLLRVVKMLLIHDLVEIDAGDTYAFDEPGHLYKAERERRAADRIFMILPDEYGIELRALWEEFDRGETPDAAFALAIDRVHPMLMNYFARGKSWKQNALCPNQVLKRLESLDETIPELGTAVKELVWDAVEKGYF